MIVAITGGSGFIGHRLALRHLGRGDRVRILTRRPASAALPCGAEIHRGDLAGGREVLARFADGADVLYHCAAELKDKARMRAVHVHGTANLLDAARGRIGRWVQLSSVGVYGRKLGGVVTESEPGAPVGEYESTKAESDRLLLDAAEGGAIRLSVLRPSIVFGSDMPNHSLFQLVSAVDAGLFFFIGPPGASANYVHVENLVDALLACGVEAAEAARVYNLSDYRTLEQFVGAIASALGRRCPSLRLPKGPVRLASRIVGRLSRAPLTESRVDALVTRVRYDTSHAERQLGYRHRVSMEDGLRELVAAWRSRR